MCREQREQRRRGGGDSERQVARAGPEKCPRGPLGCQVRDTAPGDSVDLPACCGVAKPFGGGPRRKIAHERNKGNKGKLLGMEFGEATL